MCPRTAINLDSPSRIARPHCDLCGRCAEVCPAGALRLIGRYWPVESLVDLLLRDVAFYRHSGGGVTFSGGECTMFPDYLSAALERLKARQVHTAVETSGSFDYETFRDRLLPYLDLILFDVKLADTAASLRYLGHSNQRAFENLRRLLAEGGVEIHPRIPLIPGITDGEENLKTIVETLRGFGARDVELLPYNPLGLEMYSQLGRSVPDVPLGFPDPEREKEVVEMFRSTVLHLAK